MVERQGIEIERKSLIYLLLFARAPAVPHAVCVVDRLRYTPVDERLGHINDSRLSSPPFARALVMSLSRD